MRWPWTSRRLHEVLALPDPEKAPDDVRSEVVKALTEGAERFLLGGGRLSLADWAAQSSREQVAFAAAGRLVLAAAVEAIGDPAGPAKLLAPIDGGRALLKATLEIALDHGEAMVRHRGARA